MENIEFDMYFDSLFLRSYQNHGSHSGQQKRHLQFLYLSPSFFIVVLLAVSFLSTFQHFTFSSSHHSLANYKTRSEEEGMEIKMEMSCPLLSCPKEEEEDEEGDEHIYDDSSDLKKNDEIASLSITFIPLSPTCKKKVQIVIYSPSHLCCKCATTLSTEYR